MDYRQNTTVKIKGGLGNQLFQYAFAIFLQENLKININLDISWFDKQNFRKFQLNDFLKQPFLDAIRFKPSFYKKSSDIVSASETINQNLNIFRTFLDTVYTLEQLSNSANINGINLVGLYKRILDETNFSLNPIKFKYYNLQKDIVNLNSIVNISVNNSFNDLLNLKNTDIFKLTVAKNLGKESSVIADTLSKALTYNRKLFDSIFTTDDYYGAATIDDDEYASFNKKIAEQVVFAQNSTKYLRLIKSNLILNFSVNNLKLYKVLYSSTNYAYDVKTTRYLKNILNTNSLSDTKTFNILKSYVEEQINKLGCFEVLSA